MPTRAAAALRVSRKGGSTIVTSAAPAGAGLARTRGGGSRRGPDIGQSRAPWVGKEALANSPPPSGSASCGRVAFAEAHGLAHGNRARHRPGTVVKKG